MFPFFYKSLFVLISIVAFTSPINGIDYVVNVAGDHNSGSGGNPNPTGPTTQQGDLRSVLNQINLASAGAPGTYNVIFNLPNSGDNLIMVQDILPILNLTNSNTLTIDGSNQGNAQIIIDGTQATGVNKGNRGGFLARKGTVTIQNMTIQNCIAKGGDGSNTFQGGNGGGGMGAGGALFVYQADVTLANVILNTNNATGGNGGNGTGSSGGGGGGGGMGGNGGPNAVGGGGTGGGGLGGIGGALGLSSNAGSGGGGIGPNGAGGNSNSNGSSGGGYGASSGGGAGGGIGGANAGGGGGGSTSGGAAAGGAGGGDGALTVVGNNGGDAKFGGGGGGGADSIGGNGDFGGGGGGGGGNGAVRAGAGGSGGFGGGGAGGGFGAISDPGGAGGTSTFGGGGGGGGAAQFSTPGNGGAGGIGAGAGAIGTNGGRGGFGGGGAGLGGAIFVDASGNGKLSVTGSLLIMNSTVSMGTGFVNGAAAAQDIFATSGIPLLFNPGLGQTATITNVIGDDSPLTLPGGPGLYTSGNGVGEGIIKQGMGVLHLLADNTFAGLTDVQQGKLLLSGSVATNAIVRAGGIIAGNGTVKGNLEVDGTIAPGDSIGTFHVNGTYTQTNGSVYQVEIAATSSSDLIEIGQTALIEPGSSVNVTLIGGILDTSQSYLIMHAAGGIVGDFTSVTASNIPVLIPIITYDASRTHAYLSFVQPSNPLPPSKFVGELKKNRFLTQTDYLLKAKWNASSSANVVAYRIYKGSHLVAQVAASSRLVFKTELRSKKEANKFSITALDALGKESTPVRIKLSP